MLKPRLFSLLLLALSACTVHAQEAAPAAETKPAASDSKPAASVAKPAPTAPDPAEVKKTLLQLIRWDRNAMGTVTPENPHGLKWDFSLTNNINDSAKGQSRSMPGTIERAPINNQWDVLTWDLDKPMPGMQFHNVWLNRQGVLWRNRPPGEAQDSAGGEGSIGFRFTGAKGEGHRYLLLSDDKKTAIYGIAVPFPIVQKMGKCSVEIRLGSRDGRSLVLVGEGFPASTPVHLSTTTAGHTSEQNIPADAKGTFVTGLLPPATTDEKGTREMTFSSTAGACTLHFSQPWGKGTYVRE